MPLHAEEQNRKAFKTLSALLGRGASTLALVGAGTSVSMGYPTWGRLLNALDTYVEERHPQPPKLRANRQAQTDLLWRAEEYRTVLSDAEYHQFLEEQFADLPDSQPLSSVLRALVALPFRHVLTTNYDTLLEQAHAEVHRKQATPIEWNEGRRLRELFVHLGNPDFGRRYVHLHGLVTKPETVVLTDRDYVERYTRTMDAHRRLFALFATQQVVFIGFSLSDPELTALLRETQASMGEGAAPHFALLALKENEADPLERRRLKEKYGVEAIFYPHSDTHAGLGTLLQALKEGRPDYGDLWAEPAATARLAQQVVAPRSNVIPAPAAPQPPLVPPLSGGTRSGDARSPRIGLGDVERPPRGTHLLEPLGFSPTPEAEALDSLERVRATWRAAEEPPAPTNPVDPQKGRWGGRAEHHQRRLSATVTDEGGDWFGVHLEVRSTDPGEHPLTGLVRFHLHDTFAQPVQEVHVTGGVASYHVTAYGAFTVGAEADGGETRLELDLATLPDAPREFRER